MTPSKPSTTQAIRVAPYARISTLNHGQDPEVQVRELRDYCDRRGFAIADTFVDRGISGSRERRPALDQLMSACRKRLVDAVVVYRYDRFARSLRQLVNALEEFRSLGVEFISIHEGVDTSTPNGRLTLQDARTFIRYGSERFSWAHIVPTQISNQARVLWPGIWGGRYPIGRP